ncbi:DUF4163 domain-containing protein [Croceicoccus hydrothermalis]|uniref:DUF4163 domain-containing protein n=1 Tax=Croceicoccus hydrothermalis TaxID=2867964 RepID=UPI001EFBBC89|nr:DUF4163 domain-containing protein [Croceicoccus hydrothermalis]
MFRTALATALFLPVLAGCSDNGAAEPAASRPSEDAATVAAEAVTPAEPGRAEAVDESTDDFQFAYSWPAAAGTGPLKDALTAERQRLRNEIATSASAARREALASGYPFRPFGFDKKWSVVTQTPRFVSLSAETYAYEGGAHGMQTFDALVLDREKNLVLQPGTMFSGTAALGDAVRGPMCDALDRARAERRGDMGTQGGWENECIDPVADAAMILGSSDGRRIDRLGFLIGSSVAGSHAEGSYDVTIPVTEAVIAALRPEYRDAFATAPEG